MRTVEWPDKLLALNLFKKGYLTQEQTINILLSKETFDQAAIVTKWQKEYPQSTQHVDDVTRLTEAIKVLESAGVIVPLTGDANDARKIFTFAMESADSIKRLRDALFPFASAYCEYVEARADFDDGDDYHPQLLNPELDLCLDVQVKDWQTAERILR